MIIHKTYRSIASLLGLIMLAGVFIPNGLHLKGMAFCDMENMEHTMAMGMEMPMPVDDNCTMTPSHHAGPGIPGTTMENCEMVIACACDIGTPPLLLEVPTVQQLKVPQLQLVYIVPAGGFIPKNTPQKPPVILSASYSPPLLFLANASLLI